MVLTGFIKIYLFSKFLSYADECFTGDLAVSTRRQTLPDIITPMELDKVVKISDIVPMNSNRKKSLPGDTDKYVNLN